eukprot:TRINITY_DN25659_c0_g1_i1.p1 TRINITY_DN25659_c0_g1~~TRINITY_DN25659_c0_g1_i1.p1  ORF type:complete len:203 (+),score=61.16 TRINITY_DN25659_c0_g1_i1:37-645(+)
MDTTRRGATPSGVYRSYGSKPWKEKKEVEVKKGERVEVFGKSLMVQMLLYYNIFYSICFAIIAWVSYGIKCKIYDIAWKHQMWYAVVLTMWTVFELGRLVFGYVGNLKSSVQYLIGFLSFSVLNLALVIVFYKVDKVPRNSHDRALSIVHIMFIISELVAVFFEARRQIKYHTVRFYLSLDNMDAGGDESIEMRNSHNGHRQ